MLERLPNPRAGEVWDIILDEGRGREQSGFRPALVLSDDWFNDLENGLVVIAPLTRTNRSIRSHLPIEPPNGGVMAPSVVMCDQIRSISIERCRQLRGRVDSETLRMAQLIIGEIVDI